MLRRFTARLILVCYGVVALAGQGLHDWCPDHAGCDHSQCADHHGESDGDGAHLADQESADHGAHDCDTCAICQYHSLGQIFVLAPPAVTGLAECESVRPDNSEPVVAAPHFSPSQPRAPPRDA